MTTRQQHRFAHEAMGTFFEVIIAGMDAVVAQGAAQAAFAAIDRTETQLSRFRPDSDISRITGSVPGEKTVVGLETYDCLCVAMLVHRATAGAFDPTIGALMDCLRQADGDWSAIDPADLDAARMLQGFERLDLDIPGVVALRADAAAPVALDLGAIGKGFALDLAASVLRDWDVGSALLNAGGSTALAVGDEPWLVGAGGPWGAQVGRDAVRLANASLSGSGFEVKGLHIVDPRTGLASQRHRAAWAMASSGALSDAYSTAFLVMDTTAVETCCRNQPGLSALVVEPETTDHDELVVATTGFDACTEAIS